MTTEAPPIPSADKATAPAKKPEKSRILVGIIILTVIVIFYVLSLVGVHFLQRSEGPLPPLDLSQGGGDATIVQLRLEELKPVANRLTVDVLVYLSLIHI